MLATINNTITVKRWVEVSWESVYENLTTWLPCYIEPWEYETAVNIDWENIADVFILFCDDINIIIWDKIIDKDSNNYKVKGTKVFDDVLWKHIEATILREYD